MHYHVARNGQQLGSIAEAELKAGFLEGRYLSMDLIWREGMAEWTAIGDMNWPGPAAAAAPASRAPLHRGPAASFGGSAALPAGPAPAPGIAVTSMVAGIASILLCGLGGIGSLVAIICGHKAMSRINASGGTVGGRGMAVTGLITGYISLVLAVISYIAIFASLAMPALTKVQERGNTTKQISHARQLQMACMLYATEHQGKYPDSLEQLVEQQLLEAEFYQQASQFKVPGWKGEPGFQYLGAGKDDTIPGDTPILISNAEDWQGRRVVARHDGSAMLEKAAP